MGYHFIARCRSSALHVPQQTSSQQPPLWQALMSKQGYYRYKATIPCFVDKVSDEVVT